VHAADQLATQLAAHVVPLLVQSFLEFCKGFAASCLHPALHYGPEVLNGAQVRAVGRPLGQQLHCGGVLAIESWQCCCCSTLVSRVVVLLHDPAREALATEDPIALWQQSLQQNVLVLGSGDVPSIIASLGLESGGQARGASNDMCLGDSVSCDAGVG